MTDGFNISPGWVDIGISLSLWPRGISAPLPHLEILQPSITSGYSSYTVFMSSIDAFTFPVPITAIYIASNGTLGENRYSNGDVLGLRQGTPLECRATIARSGRPPKMSIMIGAVDISDLFLTTSKNESSTREGLASWSSETSMVSDKVQLYDPIYNHQKLVCFAQAEGYERENISVTFNFTCKLM